MTTDYCDLPGARFRAYWPNADHPDLPDPPSTQEAVIDTTTATIYMRMLDQSVVMFQPALPTVLDQAFTVHPERQFVITELFIAATGSLFISATGRVRII